MRALLTAIVLVVLTAPASAAELQRLSGPSPFPPEGCGGTGTPTSASEGEPHVDVDPRDPKRIAVTWQQDRFAIDGGALTNLVATSSDGGRTFTTTRIPGLSLCTQGTRERVSDPWLSFGPQGELYLASLTFDEVPPFSTFQLAGPTQLAVSRSDDGGRSFGAPVVVVDRGVYDDREALTADPTRPGHAYMAWVFRYGSMGESGIEFLVSTADGGRTWSEPRAIYTPAAGFFPDPTIIEVLPDGTLLNVFFLLNGSEQAGSPEVIPWQVMVSRSTDAGATWSEPQSLAWVQPYPPKDPDSGRQVRAFPSISTAVAPDGTAYVAWNERPAGDAFDASTISLARTRDGGKTWSAHKVGDVRGQAFLPTLAVAGDGTVGVLFDDTRNDRRGDSEFTADVWMRTSTDRGERWSEQHVAGPFDMLTAPPTGSAGVQGIFVGDYQGMAGLPDGFAAAFAVPKPLAKEGAADVYFARIASRAGRPVPTTAPGPGGEHKLRVVVRPRRLRPGVRRVLRVRVTGGGRAIRGARVRVAGRRARTGARGYARLRVRFRRPGVKKVRVSARGYPRVLAKVRVVRQQ